MSGPVDVLAVMDIFIDPTSARAVLPAWQNDLVEARAAVAELIEAAETLDRIERGLWNESGRQDAVNLLRAALAKATDA